MTTGLIIILFAIVICLAYQGYCHDKTIDAMIEAHNITTDATIKKLRELNKRIEALEQDYERRQGDGR